MNLPQSIHRGKTFIARCTRVVVRGARSASTPEIWNMVSRDWYRDRTSTFPVPEMRASADGDDPIVPVDIGGVIYWQPRSIELSMLGSIYEEVFNERHPHYYEYEGCQIRPGDIVVDAGACEGFFTRFALERGAKVIAVEPWSLQAEALRRTFAPEIAEDRVRVVQLALAGTEGHLELKIDPKNPWGAGLGWAYKSTISELVRLATLDTLVAETWGRCDFLKADIEGAEVGLVDGATATLERDKPRISIAVYHHGDGYFDIRRRIHALRLGYRVAGKGVAAGTLARPMLLHAWAEKEG